jgi:protein-L-isoaspartate(D-aspartate) O-methyltransferase
MIEQSELGPGMSVLEIGSGGCNAALLAEVVGPAGHVVSVDVDPEVYDQRSPDCRRTATVPRFG